MSGCYYDSEDAALLAGFTNLILASDKIADFSNSHADAPPLSDPSLVWLPFRIQGEYLLAPFGGMSIPKNLLI